MEERLNIMTVAPGAMRVLYDVARYLYSSSIEPTLRDLVAMRASQMNGCAFCIAMHWREAKEDGIDDDRLHGLLAWREAPWYSERERAALAWAEAITDVANTHAPDAVYEQVRGQFNDHELADLTFMISATNLWNRLNIGFRTSPERAPEVVEAQRKAHAHAAV